MNTTKELANVWTDEQKSALSAALGECKTEQGNIDWDKFRARGATLQAEIGRPISAIKAYVYNLHRKGNLQGVSLRPPKSVGRRNKVVPAPAENGAPAPARNEPVAGPNFCPNCGFRLHEVYAALSVQADLNRKNR